MSMVDFAHVPSPSVISQFTPVAHLVEALRYKPEVVRSIPDGVIGIFH
jgi:hypothetical protein